MKLALFIGGFARTGELAARLRVAAEVVLLPAVAIAATAAASASASTSTAAIAARSVLRRAIAIAVASLEGRRCIVRSRSMDVACRRGDNRSGVRIGGCLLLTLAFALALTLSLTLGVALRIALPWLFVSLAFTGSLRGRIAIARVFATATAVAAMLAVSITSAAFLVTMAAVLVAIPVAAMNATIPIASTVSLPMAVTAMAGPIPVAAITGAIAMTVTTRLTASRSRFGSSDTRHLAGE